MPKINQLAVIQFHTRHVSLVLFMFRHLEVMP